MATTEFIQKRVEGKEKELEKLNKKLERILKAEKSGWKDNPYYYDESDKRSTIKSIDRVTKELIEYKSQLEIATQKDNSRDVKVIIDFLNEWKSNVFEFVDSIIKQYFELKQKIRETYILKFDSNYTEEKEELHKKYVDEMQKNLHGEYRKEDVTLFNGCVFKRDVKVRAGKWESYSCYFLSNYEESISKLKKELDEEAKRKYDFIIERTNAIVGTITDASNLRIGAKHDLNGIIIGTDGTASVKTVGAGGYNEGIIVNEKRGQCFHFRTLIKPVKNS